MATYTTNYKPLTPLIGFQPINEASSTQKHPLGLIIQARDVGTNNNGVGEFIYLKGVSSGAVMKWCTYNLDDGSTTLLAANAIGPVGIMMSTLSSTSLYGWLQISGKAVGLALSGFVDDANVYATATAGSVDDAVVAGDRVKNAKGASALDGPATGAAEFEISRPWMDDALAA